MKHGEADKTVEYIAWKNMHRRCSPKWPDRHNYFDRGIRVCAKWRSFTAFLAEVGRRPTRKHTLDRINNNRGYQPGNVRWATRKQQSSNSHKVRLISFRGQTKTLAEWAKKLKLTPGALHYRLAHGSVRRALTVPRRPFAPNIWKGPA